MDRLNLANNGIQGFRHELVHGFGFRSLDKIGLIAVANEQALELLMADPRKHRWVGNLISVQVKDGKDGAVGDWVEELVRVPGSREGPRFGFTIAHCARNDEVGIVEGGPIGMGDCIPKLTALVDGTRGFGGGVTRDSTGERELLEEPLHALGILRNVGVELAVRSLQVRVGNHRWSAMTWTADEDHVEVLGLDQAVEVNVDEVEPRGSTPMSEQPGLDMLYLQGFPQQGIVIEIDLSNGEVVGRPPISVHGLQLFFGEGFAHDILLPCIPGC